MYILSLSPVATCVTAASHRFIIIALMALRGRSSLILFVPKCVLISSFLQRPRKSSQNEVNRQVRSELVPGQDPKGQAGRRLQWKMFRIEVTGKQVEEEEESGLNS